MHSVGDLATETCSRSNLIREFNVSSAHKQEGSRRLYRDWDLVSRHVLNHTLFQKLPNVESDIVPETRKVKRDHISEIAQC